jgi:hypothetical protein
MIMNAPWYVPNTVIRKDLQIPTVKHEIRRYSYHYSKLLSVHPNELILNLQGTTRNKAIAKELANRSAYQIQYVIVVILNLAFNGLVCKSHSLNHTRTLILLSIEEY